MIRKSFKFITDQYSLDRGGYSKFYNIYCENCGNHILLYQKDGPGPLKRMYLDRIIAPEKYVNLSEKKNLFNLICMHCKRLIAILVVFEKENRNAYALLAYAIIKKRARGIYPPTIQKIEVK